MESEELFRREEWAASYQNTEEHPDGFWLESEGEIPEGLTGTYFRNGPGLFSHGLDRVAHPFDGHGLIASIVFTDGKAFFRSKYVQTKEYVDETAQDKILYKGTFGTLVPGGLRKNLFQIAPRNVANTGILSTAGKCLTFFEAGQPHSIDPVTLDTKGVDLLGGQICAGAPFSSGWRLVDIFMGYVLMLLSIADNLPGSRRVGGEAVCAHPVTDPRSGNPALFTFCLQLGLVACSFEVFGCKLTLWLPGLVTQLNLREFNKDMEQLSVVRTTLPGYCFLHDLGITDSHYVIFQNPVRLRMFPLLLGTLCAAHCIQWTGQPPKIHLVRRPVTARATQKIHPYTEPDESGSGRVSVRLTATSGSSFGGSHIGTNQDIASASSDAWVGSIGLDDRGSSGQLNVVAAQNGMWADRDSRSLHRPQESVIPVNTQTGSFQEAPSCSFERSSEAAAFVFHQANAYETKNGRYVVVDCIRYPHMPDFQEASSSETFVDVVNPDAQPISQLWRYVMDIASGKVSCKPLSLRAMEFPAVNPDCTGREHRYLYAAAALHPTLNRPQQALLKLDTHTMQSTMWHRGVHHYVGEPIFVPSPTGEHEDDGWILSITYDAKLHTGHCVILDASSMELLARLALKHVLPHGLHGTWAPECHLAPSSM